MLTAAAVLTLAASGGAIWWNSQRLPARGTRIAVQPFGTLGDAPGLSNFAAGLSSSLQDVLTNDQLQTLSPTEAESLKGDDLATRSEALGVGLMFSGTVQAKGSDLDVSMRLDDPVQYATLWTAEISRVCRASRSASGTNRRSDGCGTELLGARIGSRCRPIRWGTSGVPPCLRTFRNQRSRPLRWSLGVRNAGRDASGGTRSTGFCRGALGSGETSRLCRCLQSAGSGGFASRRSEARSSSRAGAGSEGSGRLASHWGCSRRRSNLRSAKSCSGKHLRSIPHGPTPTAFSAML